MPVAPAALEPPLPGGSASVTRHRPRPWAGGSGFRPPYGGLPTDDARARGDVGNGSQCSARISPMNTLVSSVNTNACRNATNSSSSMIAVASTEPPTPTQ